MNSQTVTTKRCRTCGYDIPLDTAHWSMQGNTVDGYRPDCKKCRAKSDSERRKAMPRKKGEPVYDRCPKCGGLFGTCACL